MQKTLAEIAKFVGGEVVGEEKVVIKNISGIKEASDGDLTFVANSKYLSLVAATQASAILAPPDLKIEGKSFIRCQNPSMAFAKVASLFYSDSTPSLRGIHPSAVISEDVSLGKDVAVGANVIIEKGCCIGDKTIIFGGTYIGTKTKIGEGCLIYPNVTVLERSVLGKRVIIHSGTVIGSDGFGFANVDGVQEKIPQIGIVEIHDDVELGACVTIDRARFDKTIIGAGTKIDNLVQIAHNVRIGKGCLIVSQVGISGSTVIEDKVILAGQVGLVGHITIGEGSVVMAKSGIPNSLPPKSMVFGYPAKPIREARRVNACVQRLPHYIEVIRELKKRVEDLEKKLSE